MQWIKIIFFIKAVYYDYCYKKHSNKDQEIIYPVDAFVYGTD